VPIADSLLPEFDHEMAVTRKVLERVPEDKFEWTPHPKSMSMVALATHLATIPSWGLPTLTDTELDLGGQNQNTAVTSRADLLSRAADARNLDSRR
jgi:DNA topoisomerase VI subunit B